MAARRWIPIPVHKLSELNLLADALSGVGAPWGQNKQFAPPALRGVPETVAPDPETLWACWAPHTPKPSTTNRRLKLRRR